jgi:hypothetical protein
VCPVLLKPDTLDTDFCIIIPPDGRPLQASTRLLLTHIPYFLFFLARSEKPDTELSRHVLEVEWLARVANSHGLADSRFAAARVPDLAPKTAKVRCQRIKTCFEPFLPGLLGFHGSGRAVLEPVKRFLCGVL